MWIVDGGIIMQLNFINVFWLLFGTLIGVLIGYIITMMRIRSYLKKYYPEVDFTQSPKERKKILKEGTEKDKKKSK